MMGMWQGIQKLVDVAMLGASSTRWRALACILAAAVVGTLPANAAVSIAAAPDLGLAPTPLAEQDPADELERLRGMLDMSGPDGKTDRESAVAQLMAMARPEAHRLLHDRLRRRQDPDQLRASILDALQKHLLGNPSAQFGGAKEDARKLIVTGYLGACAPLWEGANDVEDPAGSPVRTAARQALQRVPVRELDAAARALMSVTTIEASERVLVLRCLADMQQTLLARTIADQLEAPDQVVRDGAVDSLQLLTYAARPIRTKAEFEAWYAEHGSMRYVNVVERAARSGTSTYDRLRQELERLRVDAAREFVTVHAAAKPGINWLAVQQRTLSDGPAVLDACLQALRGILRDAPTVQGSAQTRHAFFRALVERFLRIRRSPQPAVQRRSALLIEVAAYLVRPEEAEFANEVRGLLLEQLDAVPLESQIAALRGLRRFPSAEARQALVARARMMLTQTSARERITQKPLLQVMLDTLASRTEPRWMAPAAKDAGKADWLKLIDESCKTRSELGLRERALLLAQTLDRTGKRVPEAFNILLALANAEHLETKFRATCLIYLEAWRSEELLAARWLEALHSLLEDTKVGMRRQAASSMVLLPESADRRRNTWFADSLTKLRSRLILEPDQGVLKALVECIKVIGRQPEMPEDAIGALKFVLGQLGTPPAPEHVFRLEPLLQALAAIAADPEARGQWLAACEPLLRNGKRDGLRLVLVSHGAADLAKDVGKRDTAASARACEAMRYLIEAAALRQGSEPWSSSEALMAEARDVRAAFQALDRADVNQRLDAPVHRLVRLAVELAAGKNQEVVQRATAWLSSGRGVGGAGANGSAGSVSGSGNGGGNDGPNGAGQNGRGQNGRGQNGGAASPGQPNRTEAAPRPDQAPPSATEYQDRMRLLAAEAQLALGKPLPALALLEARSESARGDAPALALASRIASAVLPTDAPRAIQLMAATLKATSTEAPAFRQRLVNWMRASIQHDPASRTATLTEARKHAALFAAADCPAKLREAYEQLSNPN